MGTRIDLTGQRFGRLVVEKYAYTNNCLAVWLCLCDCGNRTKVLAKSLRSGNTKSCGCFRKEVQKSVNTTHGMTRTPLYNSWRGMKERCEKPNHQEYHRYGGRGISFCPEWSDFNTFKEWALSNGYRKGLMIDRIDNNGNYSPDNCKWSDWLEQANNKINNHFIDYNGQIKTLAEWARFFNMPYSMLRSRIYDGWSIERAFNTPPGAKTGPKPKKKRNDIGRVNK